MQTALFLSAIFAIFHDSTVILYTIVIFVIISTCTALCLVQLLGIMDDLFCLLFAIFADSQVLLYD